MVASRDGGAAGEDWKMKKQQRSWLDKTTKIMEEHDNEGGGATGEGWKMKKRRRWWCWGGA